MRFILHFFCLFLALSIGSWPFVMSQSTQATVSCRLECNFVQLQNHWLVFRIFFFFYLTLYMCDNLNSKKVSDFLRLWNCDLKYVFKTHFSELFIVMLKIVIDIGDSSN